MDILIRTANFAAIAHTSQKRKDPQGTPYINHPIGVCQLLCEAGVTDLIILQGALLHDTIEDTSITFEDISQEFGQDVATLVQEVTDDKSLLWQVRIIDSIKGQKGCSSIQYSI